jgi:cellulose biosynthesis protein BcsQ
MTFTGPARVILFANKKGGVGKSTVVASVADMVATGGRRGGRKCLVIDGDPQATLTNMDLGAVGGDMGASLSKTLQFGDPLRPIRGVRPNLDVIAGGSMLTAISSAAGAVHASGGSLAANLQRSLEVLCEQEGYEMVLIDSAPGWAEELLLDVFMQIANYLIIPTKSDLGSMDPMRQLAELFFGARSGGASIELLGVVLFATDVRAPKRCADALTKITELLGGSGVDPFSVPIRMNEAAAIDMRDLHVTVQELATVVSKSKTSTLRKLRSGEAPGRTTWTGENITDLVGDFQELVYEIITRIARHEAEDGHIAPVRTAQ